MPSAKEFGTMDAIRELARPLLAASFVYSGWDVARHPGDRTQAAASLRVPRPELAVRANGVTMVAAGLALALGVFPRLAAGILAAAMVPTTLAGHPFWKVSDPQKRDWQRIQFLKNVSLVGGLLLATADDRGRRREAHSADEHVGHRQVHAHRRACGPQL